MTEQNIELIQLGSLLFLSAYHIVLYFQIKRKHYLYLGLLVFSVLVRALLVDDGSKFLFEIFPSISKLTGRKIEYLAAYATLPLTVMFIGDIFKFRKFDKLIRFFQGAGIVLLILVLVSPFSIYRFSLDIYHFLMVCAFVFVFTILSNAIRQNRTGAKYILYGAILCFCFVFVEMLKNSRLTPYFETDGPNLVNTGVLIFFFFQSVALSAIYAQSFKENERLNKELEERVSTRTELLTKSNLIKDRFIRIISHDFRTPIASLKSMLTLVKNDSISRDQLMALSKKIGTILDTSLGMFDDLLEWTKASSESNMKIIKDKVDMHNLISETLPLFDYIANRKSISLIFKPDRSSTIHVDSDVNSVKVVLRNLINNAIKFTKRKGMVEVGYKQDGQVAEIFVADNGIGIPDEMKPTIFDMESKNRRSGTSNEKSTGIGLALCKDLITQNGGKISVEDNYPTGTVFKFTLDLSS